MSRYLYCGLQQPRQWPVYGKVCVNCGELNNFKQICRSVTRDVKQGNHREQLMKNSLRISCGGVQTVSYIKP